MTTDVESWVAPTYGLLAALAIWAGGRLVGPSRARLDLQALAGIGAGFLLAMGALDALPEAIERADSPVLPSVLAALSLVVLLAAHRAGHAHGHESEREHTHEHEHDHQRRLSLYDARMATLGLTLHSLLDGVAVSGALASEQALGLFVAFFVLLHKLPEGAAAAALTYASGGNAGAARRNVLTVATASLLGSLAIFAIGPLLSHALAVTAGVAAGVGLGIAGHLVRASARKALVTVGSGVALFVGTAWLLHG